MGKNRTQFLAIFSTLAMTFSTGTIHCVEQGVSTAVESKDESLEVSHNKLQDAQLEYQHLVEIANDLFEESFARYKHDMNQEFLPSLELFAKKQSQYDRLMVAVQDLLEGDAVKAKQELKERRASLEEKIASLQSLEKGFGDKLREAQKKVYHSQNIEDFSLQQDIQKELQQTLTTASVALEDALLHYLQMSKMVEQEQYSVAVQDCKVSMSELEEQTKELKVRAEVSYQDLYAMFSESLEYFQHLYTNAVQQLGNANKNYGSMLEKTVAELEESFTQMQAEINTKTNSLSSWMKQSEDLLSSREDFVFLHQQVCDQFSPMFDDLFARLDQAYHLQKVSGSKKENTIETLKMIVENEIVGFEDQKSYRDDLLNMITATEDRDLNLLKEAKSLLTEAKLNYEKVLEKPVQDLDQVVSSYNELSSQEFQNERRAFDLQKQEIDSMKAELSDALKEADQGFEDVQRDYVTNFQAAMKSFSKAQKNHQNAMQALLEKRDTNPHQLYQAMEEQMLNLELKRAELSLALEASVEQLSKSLESYEETYVQAVTIFQDLDGHLKHMHEGLFSKEELMQAEAQKVSELQKSLGDAFFTQVQEEVAPVLEKVEQMLVQAEQEHSQKIARKDRDIQVLQYFIEGLNDDAARDIVDAKE